MRSSIVKPRIVKYFGHATRRKDDKLEKGVLQGKIERNDHVVVLRNVGFVKGERLAEHTNKKTLGMP